MKICDAPPHLPLPIVPFFVPYAAVFGGDFR
jgi:hypothetical protein